MHLCCILLIALYGGHLDGGMRCSFDAMEFEYTRNTMQGSFDFVTLAARLQKINEQLVSRDSSVRRCVGAHASASLLLLLARERA
jgi:hypothetical protein